MEDARCNGGKEKDYVDRSPLPARPSFRLHVERRHSESPDRYTPLLECNGDPETPAPSPCNGDSDTPRTRGLRLSVDRRHSECASPRKATSPCESRIPVRSPASTPTLPRRAFPNRHGKLTQSLRSLDRIESDTESIGGRSSCGDCDHAHFPQNGTTYSARARRYIVHCSPSHSGSAPDEYLTPTQRANATIRRLRRELEVSQAELGEKEREIARLTREIVQLRLRRLDDDDGAFRPIRLPAEVTCLDTSAAANHGSSSGSEVPPSLVDSGHFEELSPYNSPRTSALEKEIDRLKTEHEHEVKRIKDDSDAKLEKLVKQLEEANMRCEQLKPQLEEAQRKLEEMEKEKEEISIRFAESEEKYRNDFVHVFNKGKQAAIVDSDVTEADGPPTDIPTLLRQLEVTRQELNSVKDCDYWDTAKKLSAKEAVSIWNLSRKTMYRRMLEKKKPEQDAEVTLQFLKSAIFYFLTDRENSPGHLAAIQSILGFTDEEKAAIDKNSYLWKY